MKKVIGLSIVTLMLSGLAIVNLDAAPGSNNGRNSPVCHLVGNDGTGVVIPISPNAQVTHIIGHGDCFTPDETPGAQCSCPIEE